MLTEGFYNGSKMRIATRQVNVNAAGVQIAARNGNRVFLRVTGIMVTGTALAEDSVTFRADDFGNSDVLVMTYPSPRDSITKEDVGPLIYSSFSCRTLTAAGGAISVGVVEGFIDIESTSDPCLIQPNENPSSVPLRPLTV